MQLESPRNPTPLEAALLHAFLSNEFSGVRELRQQARSLLVARSCNCGCGTIDLMPQGINLPRSIADSPVHCDGVVIGDHGDEVGGLILFVENGLLDCLEVCSHGDGPLQLPPIERVLWRA